MRSWDSDGPSEMILIAKTDAASLDTAIGRLPARFREALIMRDIWPLCDREIAQRTGVPIHYDVASRARTRSSYRGIERQVPLTRSRDSRNRHTRP